MPRPKGYFGAEELFGIASEADSDGLDVVRRVPPEDFDAVRPANRTAIKKGWDAHVPPSLHDSLLWFLVATSARRMRIGRAQHSSMLVHSSMLSDVHFELKDVLETELAKIRKIVTSGSFAESDLDAECQRMWARECGRVNAAQFGHAPMPWEVVRTAMPGVLSDARLIVDNYRSVDRLAYESGDPATVIVIGGNTLSRGLTLEGLVSSYFVRSASAYDTLLQMGRWFGYRNGYEDLCRIWMPKNQSSWFRDLSLVEAEVREQIDRYAAESLTPRELGVRIRLHPTLAITMAAKMRNANVVSISFGSSRPQTTLLPIAPSILESNGEIIGQFIKALAEGNDLAKFQAGKSSANTRQGFVGVESSEVLKLISRFEFAENQVSFTPTALSQYIKEEVAAGGLNSWRVILMEGRGEQVELDVFGSVRTVIRSRLDDENDTVANIKALPSDRDRAIGVDGEYSTTERAVDIDVRRQRLHPEIGILRIYPIDRTSKPKDEYTEESELRRVPLNAAATAFGLVFDFPASKEPHRAVKCAVADIPSIEQESFETDLDEALDNDEVIAQSDSEDHEID
nr:Z1 domain-containing protein [Brevibacterium sp. ZH18]